MSTLVVLITGALTGIGRATAKPESRSAYAPAYPRSASRFTVCKHNATLSGAEGGCQAEVGVASAMSTAMLAEIFSGSPQTVANAAESALESHLGLTCDPVAGYVQTPCIERCAFGAVKGWSAFMIASNEDESRHRVDLDTTIKTMADTGCDMSSKYKETSEGGLAVNLVLCPSLRGVIRSNRISVPAALCGDQGRVDVVGNNLLHQARSNYAVPANYEVFTRFLLPAGQEASGDGQALCR